MFIRIPENISSVIKKVQTIAEETRQKAYLVGGPARDIIMGKHPRDVDIMGERDGISLATKFAKKIPCDITVFPEFLTARVRCPGYIIDFSTARREEYPFPGSLPVVYPGSFEEDMKRRDFTINAMAISLNRENEGEIIDIVGGLEDLKKGILRILHERSFQDDPTRILRGIRFSARFGFDFEENTLKAMKRDMEYLEKVSRERIFKELEYICKEGRKGVLLLERYSLLEILNLCKPEESRLLVIEDFSRKYSIKPWKSYLLSLFLCQEKPVYNLPYYMRKSLRIIKEMEKNSFNVKKAFCLEDEFLPLLSSAVENPEEVYRFYRERDRIKPMLTGEMLRNLGIPEGPEMGKIMDEIMKMRWKGKIKTLEDEVAFVKRRKNA